MSPIEKTYRFPRRSEKRKQARLFTRSQEPRKSSIGLVSVPERSYPVVKRNNLIIYIRLTVRKITREAKGLPLLVLLLSVLCKSSQRTLSFVPPPSILARKRMQRYALFSNLPNFLGFIFQKKEKFSYYLTIRKPYTLLYYIRLLKYLFNITTFGIFYPCLIHLTWIVICR